MTALFAAIAFLTMDMHGITAPTAVRGWTVIAMRFIDADKFSFILALMDAALSSLNEDTILDLVDSAPTVDAVPVVHGRWETNSDRPDTLICSVCKCGFDMWKHDPHNYCPNCGARMQEVE